LTGALVLTITDESDSLTIYTNACREGVGAVLMQHERVITYASRQLMTHEQIMQHAI